MRFTKLQHKFQATPTPWHNEPVATRDEEKLLPTGSGSDRKILGERYIFVHFSVVFCQIILLLNNHCLCWLLLCYFCEEIKSVFEIKTQDNKWNVGG